MSVKRCSKCEEEKDLDEFYQSYTKSGTLKVMSCCKNCHKNRVQIAQNERYHDDPEFRAKKDAAARCSEREKYARDPVYEAKKVAASAERYAAWRDRVGTSVPTRSKRVGMHYTVTKRTDRNALRAENQAIARRLENREISP